MTEESREQYRHTASFKESLGGILSREKFNLRSSRNKIQENIQRVLFESRLLEVEDQSAEMKQGQSKPSETEETQRYVSSIKSVETLISTDELNRRVTYEEVENSRQHSTRSRLNSRTEKPFTTASSENIKKPL